MSQISHVLWPRSGAVGVLSGDVSTLPETVPSDLAGVEIRVDLLLKGGQTVDQVCETLKTAEKRGLPIIFTVRQPSHGGVFDGPESERLKIYRRALAAKSEGPIILDAEWGSEVAGALHADGAPLILSHHDFGSMLSSTRLAQLTTEIEAWNPWAVKIVPTASKLAHSARMLEWVAGATENGPRRIGFAMGPAGVASRILAVGHGAPVTYASFGDQVAPGQISLAELCEIYRTASLDRDTRLFGVAGDKALSSFSPLVHNPAFARRQINAVYLPLEVQSFGELTEFVDILGVEGLSVTIPFKEDAFRAAGVADARSQACRASNTLLYRRTATGERTIESFNTDYDGVLVPLGSRLGSLDGVSVAVLGNGGAARGAVLALKESGASPTLYFRNIERGGPVAKELGVPGRPLTEIESDRHQVYINATPLGGNIDDPSPVPDSVLTAAKNEPPRIAFDMVYQPPRTTFLKRAGACGAIEIRGREMLLAQGTVQFHKFSGQTVSLDEFAASYERGEELRAI
jgi:3-dehydroquinate dehydratase/shikimate dehydrogenase